MMWSLSPFPESNMFTGLIQRVGKLAGLERRADCCVVRIDCESWDEPLVSGESVSVNGVCLTVAVVFSDGFVCNVLDETLSVTNLTGKRAGALLNLERAIRADERFGGHFVSGHIDGMGKVISAGKSGADRVIEVECDSELMKGIVLKGSIACDGVSLTVSGVSERSFKVNIIPFTWENTALAACVCGEMINIETDMLGKYVRKYTAGAGGKSGVTWKDLERAGFVAEN
jgi:riboflavin synthase